MFPKGNEETTSIAEEVEEVAVVVLVEAVAEASVEWAACVEPRLAGWEEGHFFQLQ